MNRFKQMVDAGVAKFEYKPNAPERPVLDEFVRTYNIYWGQPTDTHMTCVDGKYIITGSMFDREKGFFKHGFLWSPWIRGLFSPPAGYHNFHDFLRKNHKDFIVVDYNGSSALEIIDAPCDGCGHCSFDDDCDGTFPSAVLKDSSIPLPLSTLEHRTGVIKSIQKECKSVSELVKKLNESHLCKGEFFMLGGKVYNEYNNQIYCVE